MEERRRAPGALRRGERLYVSYIAQCVGGHDLSSVSGDPDMAGLGWKQDGQRERGSGTTPHGVIDDLVLLRVLVWA